MEKETDMFTRKILAVVIASAFAGSVFAQVSAPATPAKAAPAPVAAPAKTDTKAAPAPVAKTDAKAAPAPAATAAKTDVKVAAAPAAKTEAKTEAKKGNGKGKGGDKGKSGDKK